MELTAQLTSLAEWAGTEADATRLRSLAALAAEVNPDMCFYASLASTLDEIAESKSIHMASMDLHKLANECRAESRRLVELAEAALEVAW